jgi:CRISPR-associated protein Csd2
VNIPSTITDPNKRYDFLLLFDVTDGNPNGDPDAGNLPRVDPETMQGIVTDVCLKRKIRNYVDLVHSPGGELDLAEPADGGNGFGIFVRDSGIALNTKLREGAVAVGAKPDKKKSNMDARTEMCRRYYDVRLFGGVLSVGDYNCGQVRGPMQLTFSRSIDPIIPGDIAITRVAITREGEAKETEIGRKAQVPYGLYLGKGFYSPMLGKDTRVTSEDLRLFWEAVLGMFEIDRSASRGFMQMQKVVVFVHENGLGNAPSGKLFARLSVKRKDGVEAARSIDDYSISLASADLPAGVELVDLVG